MPRIAGVDIPNDKRLIIALQYIHGVGPHVSEQIIKEIGVSQDVRAGKLSEDEVSRIASVIDRNS